MSVLIVGAGVAGLSCGYNIDALSGGMLNLQILEARSRVGGRIQNLENASFVDFDLDQGAQDLFFADRDQLEALVPGSTVAFDFEDRPVSFTDCDGDGCAEIADLDPPRGDFYRNILQNSYFVGDTLSNYVTQTLCEPIEGSVLVEQVVTEIDYTDPNRIVATTEDGNTYEADQLVVAVPISQLRKGAITFRPPLSSSNAGRRIVDTFEDEDSEPEQGRRIWVEFSEKFYDDVTRVDGVSYWDAARSKLNYCTAAWENDGDDCEVQDDETSCGVDRNKHFCRCEGPTSRDGVPNGATAVCPSTTDDILEAIVETDGSSCNDWCADLTITNVVTIQGNRCSSPNRDTCGLAREELLQKVLEDLDFAYDGAATNTFTGRSHFTDYEVEPHIEMVNARYPSNIDAYLTPVDDRIWFAGDYTRRINDNSAAESGMRVAQSVYDNRNNFTPPPTPSPTPPPTPSNDLCGDDPTWQKLTRNRNQRKNCVWVGEDRTNFRCRREGLIALPDGSTREVLASEACRLTCGTCP